MRDSNISTIAGTIGGILLLLLVVFFLFFLDSVPPNHVGVVYNKINSGEAIQEEVLSPGYRIINPISKKIYDISTYTHSLHLKPGTDKEGEPFDDTLVTQTRDGQWLSTQAEVQYRILPEDAVFVFEQFRGNNRDIDDNIKEKMPSVIQRALEAVTTKYDVVGALGAERGKMQAEIEESVSKELATYGITMQSFTLVDTDAGDEIESAIAQEAVEQQNIETAKQQQEKQRINNQTDLERTQNQAERKQIEAEAEAQANKQIADSVTPELVDYMEALARQEHGYVTVQGISDIIVDTQQ